ncbi:MAG: NAD(P)/FAD-dependent oxidoreductase [Peptococcaceae bacterium]|jgi:predicted Rossmann fold flavoprotein|nr:NAD(P)/FAD-dependent oxidoreductase [Peptococcaceae bacterium]MBQ5615786.1 NAD(P)/FAD-dependent oxidoreductase [Peptococcaceae bacterium]MBQ5658038.1 NAD(P)/FAD-dependent oxidoreductase [Peptococcaceae bacterium]
MAKRVIVIGAGASGMMAALMAAENGAQVMLFEKNDRPGKKILISGKGRCNVTTDKDTTEIINSFLHNGKFLYTALASFSNQQVKYFFEEAGVPLKVERGERVFPVSDQAKDIVNALRRKLEAAGVDLWLNATVKEVLYEEGRAVGVLLPNGRKIAADCVIVATGGASYPGTGSTGDGYHFARKAGHSIVTLRPSLIPLECAEGYVKELQGLSLKNVTFTITTAEGKKLAEDFGEMLFTHFGVSGPIVLTQSYKAVDYWQKNKQPLIGSIDFKPALSREKLDARFLREIEEQNKKQLKNSLPALMPSKLIPVFLKRANVSGDKAMHQITKEERMRMVDTLKDFRFTITKARPIEEAIVTAGGVSVKEVSPKTMESKLVKGLYFTGEVLDIDGMTGGFNLQAAFSTGYLAGMACTNEDSALK